MNPQTLLCPKCRTTLPETLFNVGAFRPCPACAAQVQCEVFSAFTAGPRIGRPGEPLVNASEASCFFHVEKRAVMACEACGRFVCGLCDLELEGQHICPSCLAAGRKKGALRQLDHFRFSWAGLAFLLAFVPAFFWFFMWMFTIVTAPAALVVAVIGWRKPPSLTGRKRVLLYAFAVLLASAQIVGWVVYFVRGIDWWLPSNL